MIKVGIVRLGAGQRLICSVVARCVASLLRAKATGRAFGCELPLSSETGHTGRFSKRTR